MYKYLSIYLKQINLNSLVGLTSCLNINIHVTFVNMRKNCSLTSVYTPYKNQFFIDYSTMTSAFCTSADSYAVCYNNSKFMCFNLAFNVHTFDHAHKNVVQ